MKAIICEMCSGRDFIKDGDFYVCQSCGTKYTAESAKKLMMEIEGKVDVSGSTIQVDNTKQTEILRQAAEHALSSHDWENVDNYYSKIFEDDPTDWEAAFFPTYVRAINCKITNIEHATNSVKNCLATVVHLISDGSMSEEKKTNAVAKLVVYVKNIGETFEKTACEMLNNAARKELDLKEAMHEYIARASAVVDMLFTLGSVLETCFPDNAEISKFTVSALKSGMQFWADYHRLLDNWRSKKEGYLKTYGGIIRKYEPEYLFPAAHSYKYLPPISQYVYAERDKSEKELTEEAEAKKKAEEIARQRKEEAKKRRPITIAIVAAIAVFLIIGIPLIKKNNAYNEAVRLLEDGYPAFRVLLKLEELKGYKDSDELIDMINDQLDKLQGEYVQINPSLDGTQDHIRIRSDDEEFPGWFYLFGDERFVAVIIDVDSKTVTDVGWSGIAYSSSDFHSFNANEDYTELDIYSTRYAKCP